MEVKYAKFGLGAVVQHRLFSFRGIIFDVDIEFSNSEEWYLAIPENVRPRKNQPFYHLYAQNEQTTYEAYVSEQNLLADDSDEPLRHPSVEHQFRQDENGAYCLRFPPHH